ncbi:centromere protein O isoform X2 [Thalassophryne amazonica]|nr:centromere protein O isoform X2 [Thalassophryne amazonica]
MLEAQVRSRKTQQKSRVMELKAKVEALISQRDQLKTQIQTHKNLYKLRLSMDKQALHETDEEIDKGSENYQLLQLMARYTQLKDLLYAHHMIGGYDVIKTRQGNGVCVSLATSYEGVYLDTYNLEISLKPKLKITRHNIPPFIPLTDLAEQNNMQTDIRAFLDTLSQHLNAFASRKQQLKLVKELHKSVQVMESNVLCSVLVLMLTVPKDKTALLCTIEYADPSRCLPTKVTFDSEENELPESLEWKKNSSLLMDTPVHKVLTSMRNMRHIL